MTNKILMVAFDFPPCQSAGVQRTLKFCEYLPNYGWNPVVLTAKPHIYDRLDRSIGPDADNPYPVYRATGLNSVKHISFKGKHFSALNKPDRFFTWYWDGKRLGKKIIAEHKPSILWSTFPNPTAHRIAGALKEHSKLPWVADFRDPFAGNNPLINVDNAPAKRIDEHTARNADLLIFTTEKAANLYLKTYSFLDEAKVKIIQNGYNEEIFEGLEQIELKKAQDEFVLLHSGALYDNGRNPRALFEALGKIKSESANLGKKIKVIFRGVPEPGQYAGDIERLGLHEHVEFQPSVAYKQSIQEMCAADGLLLLQGKMFNNQIPGKVYEYLRAEKPVLALADHDGATADLLKPVNHALVADMTSASEIESLLFRLVNEKVSEDFDYSPYSRTNKAKQLADYFARVKEPSMENSASLA